MFFLFLFLGDTSHGMNTLHVSSSTGYFIPITHHHQQLIPKNSYINYPMVLDAFTLDARVLTC